MSDPDFITTLGTNWVSLLTAPSAMPYLGPTYGGTCATATDYKSVFDLGLLTTPAVIIALADLSAVGDPKGSDFVTQTKVTWRCYIVGANFNRATGSGRFGELGEPGTNNMIADMIRVCHGQMLISDPTPELQGARLAPRALRWIGDSNSKIIYEFDWWHFWPLVQAS